MTALARTEVLLGFYGDDLMPEEITRRLGCLPTVGVKKGGIWRTSLGCDKTASTGSWRLKADAARPGDLNAQIAGIFSQLSPEPAVWIDLSQQFRAVLFCGLFLNEGNEGVDLTADTVAAIAERKLIVDFDIYSGNNDDESEAV